MLSSLLTHNNMKLSHRIVATLIAILLVVFVSWLTGYDFNHRGHEAVITTLLSVVFGVAAFALTSTEWQ